MFILQSLSSKRQQESQEAVEATPVVPGDSRGAGTHRATEPPAGRCETLHFVAAPPSRARKPSCPSGARTRGGHGLHAWRVARPAARPGVAVGAGPAAL